MNEEKAFDVKYYFDTIGFNYSTEGKNIGSGWIGIDCPFCQDTSNHCGIRLKDNFFSCWVCSNKGGITNLIHEITNLSFSHIKENILPEYQKIEYGIVKKRKKINKDLKMPDDVVDIKRPNRLIKEYFGRRKFSLDLIEKCEIKWCNVGSDYPLRLFVPVIDNGVIVSYVLADVTGKANTKYIICSDDNSIINKREILYGIDNIIGRKLFIVEGITDQWRLGDYSIALLGKRLYQEQAKRISKLVERKNINEVFLFLDKDAKREIKEGCNTLSQFIPPEVEINGLFLDKNDVDDPAELTEKEVKTLIAG